MSSMYLNVPYSYTDPVSGTNSLVQFTDQNNYIILTGPLVNNAIYSYTFVQGNTVGGGIAIFGPDTNTWQFNTPQEPTVNGNTVTFPTTTQAGSGTDGFQAACMPGWTGAPDEINNVQFTVSGPNPAPQPVTIHLL